MAERLQVPLATSRRALPGVPFLVSVALVLAFAASRIAIVSVPSERENDEGIYLLSARSVTAGHELFLSVFSSQPPAFLEALAASMRLFGESLETARLMTLAFSLAALAAIAFIGRRLAGPWAGAASIAALGVSATFGDLAHVVEAEMPALAVALLSLCACLHARRHAWHRGWLVACGALLALGALFKLIVVPLAAPLGLLLLLAPDDDAAEWRLDGRGFALLGRVAARSLLVAAGAAAVAVVPLCLYDSAALYQQTVAFHIAKHDAYKLTPLGNLCRAFRHVSADGAVAWTAVAGVLLMLLRNRLAALWLLTWSALMLVVISAQAPLFWRHFVLLSPPVALAAGAAAPLVARFVQRPGTMLLTLAFIALWIATTLLGGGRRGDAVFPLLPGGSSKDYSVLLIREASEWIRNHTEPSELVVSDDPLVVFLAGRQAPPGLCDTSTARIRSESLTLEIATRESAAARVIVLRKAGRLSRLSGYNAWLGRHYELQRASETGIDDRRRIWIRRGDAAAARAEKPSGAGE
jgi:4-amino-4-deoxy-L-arabinose transferase-like glycosyltransferase